MQFYEYQCKDRSGQDERGAKTEPVLERCEKQRHEPKSVVPGIRIGEGNVYAKEERSCYVEDQDGQ
jgi:hypothetical protein